MHYSSVAHLSNQFKKVTGLTPSAYKQLKEKHRRPLEEMENQMAATKINIRTVLPLTRSEEHTSELQSLMRTSYAVFCLKKKKKPKHKHHHQHNKTETQQ